MPNASRNAVLTPAASPSGYRLTGTAATAAATFAATSGGSRYGTSIASSLIMPSARATA
jgi:hypothetical protein